MSFKLSKNTIETTKTIIITAMVFTTLGVGLGYFGSIEMHGNARQQVVQDIKSLK